MGTWMALTVKVWAVIDAEIEIARDHPDVADGTECCAAWNGRGGGGSTLQYY